MHLGLGFFTPERPDLAVRRHLHFIISDPDESERVVVANLSTKPCPSGEELRVEPHEHDKLSQPSYLRFDNVRVTDGRKLAQLINGNGFQVTTNAGATLLAKIQQAVCASRAVPIEAKDLLGEQGFCGS